MYIFALTTDGAFAPAQKSPAELPRKTKFAKLIGSTQPTRNDVNSDLCVTDRERKNRENQFRRKCPVPSLYPLYFVAHYKLSSTAVS